MADLTAVISTVKIVARLLRRVLKMANLAPNPSGEINETSRRYINTPGLCQLLERGNYSSSPEEPAEEFTVMITGHHYSLAKEPPPGGFSPHGTLIHFHSDASQPLGATNLPIDVFGASGFFGDEVVRGFSLHDLSSVSGTVTSASIKFKVADMTAFNGTAIGGTHGEPAFSGTLEARAYTGGATPQGTDFDLPTTLLGTFEITGGVAPGDEFQFTVPPSLIQDPSFGLQIRRQDETPFVNDEGICFNMAELTVTFSS